MDGPAIKGSAFVSLAEDVRRLVEQGRISREELEVRLDARDLEILGRKVLDALWYPIATYRRLTELLMDVEGGGRSEYVERRGASAAERLFAAGLYRQLARGEEMAREKRVSGATWTEREGNLMATLAGAIFNFARWRFVTESEEGGRFAIEVEQAEPLPEVARYAAQGFIAYTASRLSGAPVRVVSERPSPDRVVFRWSRAPNS